MEGNRGKEGASPHAVPTTRPGRGGGAGGGPADLGNALETMRIASTVLVLFYHAALTYLARPMRLTMWLVYDPVGHIGFDAFAYWVNGFVMPVFFFAAGVSAPAACESRGPRVFVEQRAKRLLRPLLFGILVLLLPSYLVWGYGMMVTGQIELENILTWRYPPAVTQNLYGLAHFWFLEYLFLVCLLWCAGWMLRRRFLPNILSPDAEDGWVQRAFASPLRPLWLAIPTLTIFCLDTDTMIRVDNNVVPNLLRLLHYTYFFLAGGWIARVRAPRTRLIPHSSLYLVLSFALFAVMSPLLLSHTAAPLSGAWLWAFVPMAALFPWLTIFGSLGVFMKRVHGKNTVMRYLSESSFWIYLFHVPVVAFCQVMLLNVGWPAVAKFLFTGVVALGSSLLTYEYAVRRSLVGEIINGARKRSKSKSRLAPELGWIAGVLLFAAFVAGGAWYGRVFFWGNNLYAVIPGQLYRSARLSPKDLDRLITRDGVKTVVTITTGSTLHGWYAPLDKVCRQRQVQHFPLALRPDRNPPREVLRAVVDILDHCPRPILVQGYRGIDANGFASAVGLLLADAPPDAALAQFSMAYGQFGGPEHSALGQTILCYRSWLADEQLPHTPDRFRAWARDEYLVRSIPARPPVDRDGPIAALAARPGR